MPIRVLDDRVIAQIAAGEVVERPASVVKELVENALDAGAAQITVEIRGGGTNLIRVADNGSGIPAGEVALAFERHATSKVNTLNDLTNINTLGFRGEALASIAAVADVDLLTCAAGETMGTYVSLRDGKMMTQNGQARPQGTTITVKNLFRSVPARLKFLKSVPTENSHTSNVISQYALAYPEVSFSLFIEGKPILRTPGSGKLIESMVEIYGLEIAKEMLEIKDGGEWDSGQVIKVNGLAGTPAIGRTSRNYISFFVNRRWITSRQLTWAVEEAYHGLLMQDKHPVAVINITIPPAEVDANVHPTKTEIKFVNEGAVFGAVQKAVRRTILQQTPIPKIEEVAAAYRAEPAGRPVFWPGNDIAGTVNRMPASVPQTEPKALPILRVLGQAGQNYIIAEGNDGIYIIDQHAAHERIRYDQIREQRVRHKVEVQGLLEAATFEVTIPQAVILKMRLQELADYGFTLEAFGERTYLVRTIPAMLNGRDWGAALREMLDGFASGDKRNWTETLEMSIACHSAVRAGQALSIDEMRELVRLLEQTAMPRTCPHGRPTVLHLSLNQMEREFGRS